MTQRALIVGVGRVRHGDDAVGILIAQRLLGEELGNVARIVDDAGTGWAAIEGAADCELLVLIDAAMANEHLPVGAWGRLEFPAQADALVEYALRDTHTASIGGMLRLAQALGQLPARVWIYAIGGTCFEPECDPSPAVRAAIEVVAAQVDRDVRAALDPDGSRRRH